MRKLLYLLTITAFIHQAQAFTLITNLASRFPSDEVTINVADHTCTGISNWNPSEILDLVTPAINKFWNRVPSSRLTLKAGGLVSVSANFKTDAICQGGSNPCNVDPDLVVSSGILIACNEDSDSGDNGFNDGSILGLTAPTNISGKDINGALFLLNGHANSTLDTLDTDAMISLLAHEIGHAVGLGHSPVRDSLMYYENLTNRRALGWDDYDGITYLYPARQPEILGCGTIGTAGPQGHVPSIIIGILLLLATIGASKAFTGRRKLS